MALLDLGGSPLSRTRTDSWKLSSFSRSSLAPGPTVTNPEVLFTRKLSKPPESRTKKMMLFGALVSLSEAVSLMTLSPVKKYDHMTKTTHKSGGRSPGQML